VQPAAAADQPSAAAPADAADESTLDQVEAELRATRNDLQSTVEELEASNEELKAANEEVMSINEELQSTNEELETSKEELQSLNEELSTVNSQLENKITELESANDDLHNLHVNTDVATLFLDTRFRIRRFTPAMTRLLNLIPADIGRPLSDFATPVNSDDLLKVATEVLDRLVPADAEVRTDDRWYLRRVLPYRTADNRIDGVVITYTDITTAKKDEAKIRQLNKDLEERVTKRTRELESAIRGVRETRDHLAAILANTADGIIIIDPAGTIQSFNPAAEMIFGYSADEVVGKNVQRLMPEPFAAEHTEYIGNYLRTGKARIIGIGREVLARRKDGSTVPIDLRIAELRRDDEHLFIGSIRDLTLTKEREADMRMLQAQLAELTARERRRIGLDLHDHVGQSIAASAMVASTLEHKLRSAGSDEADAAAELVTQMREAHSQVREIAKGLAPVMTPDQNIATALAELAKRTHAVHHLACDFASNGKVTIKSLDVTDHLYHIAAESVSNAIRHARASHIHIALTRDDQNLTMIVRDDGVGLPPNHKMQAGIGMNIMRYRANVIGAQLDITPAEGGGTQVRCVLPIPNRE
jgi:two-component system CheB/CheR fusion protein